MPISADFGATAMDPFELQKAIEDFALDAAATLDQEHDGQGHHTAITCDSLGPRVTGARIPITAGLHFQAGPWLVGETDAVPGPSVIRPDALTANVNDYAPRGIHEALVVELDATAARTITGIAVDAPLRRRYLRLVNRSNYTITLESNSGSSLSAYRMFFGGSNGAIPSGTFLDLYYDPGAPIWRGQPTTAVSVINQVQKGVINFTGGGSDIETAAISTVNVAKAFVVNLGYQSDGASTVAPIRVELSNGNTVTARRDPAGNALTMTVGWTVVEYA